MQWNIFQRLKKWTIKPQKDTEATEMHITEWKKPVWKGYLLYDSNRMTFQKQQNYEDSKKINGCQGVVGGGEKGMKRQST